MFVVSRLVHIEQSKWEKPFTVWDASELEEEARRCQNTVWRVDNADLTRVVIEVASIQSCNASNSAMVPVGIQFCAPELANYTDHLTATTGTVSSGGRSINHEQKFFSCMMPMSSSAQGLVSIPAHVDRRESMRLYQNGSALVKQTDSLMEKMRFTPSEDTPDARDWIITSQDTCVLRLPPRAQHLSVDPPPYVVNERITASVVHEHITRDVIVNATHGIQVCIVPLPCQDSATKQRDSASVSFVLSMRCGLVNKFTNIEQDNIDKDSATQGGTQGSDTQGGTTQGGGISHATATQGGDA
jgi:hypothetical protein